MMQNLSLKRSKQLGAWLCLGTLLAGGLFLLAIFQGSYWALAIPVAIAVMSVLHLVFWIGYTISTVDGIPEEAEQYHDPGSRRAAQAICVGSILLAVAFLAGLMQGSYLALALPVAIAVLGFLGMVFWIGWAIVTQKTTLSHMEEGRESEETDAMGEGAVERNAGEGGVERNAVEGRGQNDAEPGAERGAKLS